MLIGTALITRILEAEVRADQGDAKVEMAISFSFFLFVEGRLEASSFFFLCLASLLGSNLMSAATTKKDVLIRKITYMKI